MTSRIFVVVVTLALAGCGGSPFTSSLFENSPDGGPVGTGGGTTKTDAVSGAGGAGTGKSVGETGGRVGHIEAGGAIGSGGSNDAGAGSGGLSSGGASTGTGDTSNDSGGKIGSGGVAPSSGGTAVDAGCAPVTHDNGIGDTWQDCVPLNTHDLEQAMKACVAHTGDVRKCVKAPGCGSAPWVVQDASDPNDYIWGYEGNTAGYVGEHGGCPNSIPWG